MPNPSSPDYLHPYEQAVREHGPGFRATLWGTEQAQRLRFDVMIELAGFEDCVIVDIGCGQGDFAARLLERQVPFARFVGIDAMTPMVDKARSRSLDRCQFVAVDVVANPAVLAEFECDFVTLSGTLNTMGDAMARRLIIAGFEVAAQGIVFNFLSNRPHQRWAGRDLTPARRFDTAAWLDWAMDQTSRVSFTQSYLDGHDATIMMLHDEA